MKGRSKTFEEAAQENINDFKRKMDQAIEKATEQAMININTHAHLCIEDYYSEYITSSYHRSKTLHRSILPIFNIQKNSKGVLSTAGIEFDSWILEEYANDPSTGNAYTASKKYGMVDCDWVIENYLNGIHPRTDGSSIPGEAEYIPETFLPSPDEKMKKNLEECQKSFQSNLYKYFMMTK